MRNLRRILIVISIALAISCRGLNDNEIDPVLLAHAKALIDLHLLENSRYLLIYQVDCHEYWEYSCEGTNTPFLDVRYWTTEEYGNPTDLIKYKDKYILFDLAGKPGLEDDMLYKGLEISPKEERLLRGDSYYAPRWYYLKCKNGDKSDFIMTNQETLVKDVPRIRYFTCNEQDSAIYYASVIDMSAENIVVYWKEKDDDHNFFSADKLTFNVTVENRSDSVICLGTSFEKGYGYFVVKNGNASLPCKLVKVENAIEYKAELYGVVPHTTATFFLETIQKPIHLEGASKRDYSKRMHYLIHDSIYYMPAASMNDVEGLKVWNKKFKMFFPYSYYYDGMFNNKKFQTFWDEKLDMSDFDQQMESP